MRVFLNYIAIVSILLNQTQYSIGFLSYFLVIINLIYSLIQNNNSSKLKFDIKYLALIAIIILSFLVNTIPKILNSEIKFLGFLVVLLFSSNLVNNTYLKFNKIDLLRTINNVFLLFTFICFLGLLVGVFAKFNVNETAGGFAGIFNNSMALAPVCATIIIYYSYLSSLSKKVKLLNLAIIGAHFYLLFLSGSRSALLALVVALLFFIFKLHSNKLLFFIRKYWYVGIVLLIFSFNLDRSSLFKVFINKFETEERMEKSSRRSLWNNRLKEFATSPVFGIGFNSVNLDISASEFSQDSGTIEPGSSWLFLLSTLGILGVLIYLFILTDFFRGLFSKNTLYENYLLTMLVFLTIHMLFEGYIFAVGNIFVYVFYLTLSNFSNLKTSQSRHYN